MSGINKVILIGTLGKDVELKHTGSGDAVANISIATSEKWTDKSNGQAQEKTEWHRVVLFKNNAENASKYLAKGSKVYIEGKLQTRKWQNKQGIDQYTTEIICFHIQFLNKKSDNDSQLNYKPKEYALTPVSSSTIAINKGDDFDDDIPF